MLFEEARLLDGSSESWQRLILSVGARWDGHAWTWLPTRAATSPRAGDATTARSSAPRSRASGCARTSRWPPASAGAGVRPSAFELFADGIHGGVTAVQLGNRDLVEESNVNAEMSVRYEGRRVRGLALRLPQRLRRLHLPGRHRRERHDARRDPARLHLPTGRCPDRGLEAALDVAPLDWLELGLAYTLLDTRNQVTGSLLPQTPPDRLLARLRLERRPRGRSFTLAPGPRGRFVGEGRGLGSRRALRNADGPYILADLTPGRVGWAADPARPGPNRAEPLRHGVHGLPVELQGVRSESGTGRAGEGSMGVLAFGARPRTVTRTVETRPRAVARPGTNVPSTEETC